VIDAREPIRPLEAPWADRLRFPDASPVAGASLRAGRRRRTHGALARSPAAPVEFAIDKESRWIYFMPTWRRTMIPNESAERVGVRNPVDSMATTTGSPARPGAANWSKTQREPRIR